MQVEGLQGDVLLLEEAASAYAHQIQALQGQLQQQQQQQQQQQHKPALPVAQPSGSVDLLSWTEEDGPPPCPPPPPSGSGSSNGGNHVQGAQQQQQQEEGTGAAGEGELVASLVGAGPAAGHRRVLAGCWPGGADRVLALRGVPPACTPLAMEGHLLDGEAPHWTAGSYAAIF